MNESRVHMVAFYKTSAVPPTDYASLTPVNDGIFALAGNAKLYVLGGMRLVVAFAAPGDTAWTGARFRVNAASLLKVAYPSITPVGVPPVDSTGDPNVQNLLEKPLYFAGDEALGVDYAASTVGTAGVPWALLMFAQSIEPVPDGEAFWIRGTDPTTDPTSATEWTSLASLTWDDGALPEGEYAIIGFVHVGPGHLNDPGVAARLKLVGRSFRPGTISVGSTQERTHAMFYDGSLGVLGTFKSYAPPGVEVLGSTTAGHEVYLRIVRIG